MNRAPIVLGSTAVGLGLILSFHTRSPATVHVKSSAPTTSPIAGSGTGTTSPSRGSSPTTAPSAGASPTTPATTTRSATGQDIVYQYGDIQLKVTERGTRISNIDVVQNGADDPRSAQINSIAVPMLTSQALSAQSSQIDGVSGASFTSAAYSQALQSAIDALPS